MPVSERDYMRDKQNNADKENAKSCDKCYWRKVDCEGLPNGEVCTEYKTC